MVMGMVIMLLNQIIFDWPGVFDRYTMLGDLFLYHEKLAAFEGGKVGSERCIVLIGGLTDGLLTIPYSEPLGCWAASRGWCVVHPLLASSYHGYGTSSIDEDASAIRSLVENLRGRRGKRRIFLLGHSTGCQDILRYMERFGDPSGGCLVDGIILQGGVSDRDYLFAHDPEGYQKIVNWAAAMTSERETSKVLYPTLVDGVALTARRAHALYSPHGDEDYFSEDLTAIERRKKFRRLHESVCVVFSGEDEYVPGNRLAVYARILEAYEATVASDHHIFRKLIIEGADHGISAPHHQDIFFATLGGFLRDVCPEA